MNEEQLEIVPDSEAEDILQDAPEVSDDTGLVKATNHRMVPLEALEAERNKRQDLEAQNRALQDFMLKSKPTASVEEDSEDDEDFITKAEMKRRIEKATFSNKREVLEEAFCQSRPEAVEMINENLEQIIKQYPWLAQSIDTAPNRYARAYDIVKALMPNEKVTPASKFTRPQADARRIIENSQKPGNPATIAKASNTSNADYLRSIAGKPEFREYRRKMLSGG